MQLLHLAGYKVVTTASESNWPLLKSYGADALFDYKDEKVSEKIKEVTGDSLKYALDWYATSCRSFTPTHLSCSVLSEDSPAKVANSMGKSGGTTVCILPCDQSKLPRKDVKIIETLLYTAMDVSSAFPVPISSLTAKYRAKTPLSRLGKSRQDQKTESITSNGSNMLRNCLELVISRLCLSRTEAGWMMCKRASSTWRRVKSGHRSWFTLSKNARTKLKCACSLRPSAIFLHQIAQISIHERLHELESCPLSSPRLEMFCLSLQAD